MSLLLGDKFDKLMAEALAALEPEDVRKVVGNLMQLSADLKGLVQEIRDGKISITIELRRNQ